MELDAIQIRIVGSLIEKQLTTPQQYPLSANALLLACNQLQNREPVVAFHEDEVIDALDRLRDLRLVRFVLPSHGRSAVRYRQVLDEVLGIGLPELALMALLFLRGPQTGGELRARSERMSPFADLNEIEAALEGLARREDPLVVRLARQPGRKEERWSATWNDAGMPPASIDTGAGSTSTESGGATGAQISSLPTSMVNAQELAEDVARLAAELDKLKDEVRELRESLGG